MNDSGREKRERQRWPPSPPPPPHTTTSLSISTGAAWHISRHWGWQQATHCSESIQMLQPPQSTLSCRLVMYPDATCESGLVRNHVPHAAQISVRSRDLNVSLASGRRQVRRDSCDTAWTALHNWRFYSHACKISMSFKFKMRQTI